MADGKILAGIAVAVAWGEGGGDEGAALAAPSRPLREDDLTFDAFDWSFGLRFKCEGSVLMVDVVDDDETDTHSSESISESEASEGRSTS